MRRQGRERLPARATPKDVVTRGVPLDRPEHPVRTMDRPRRAGLLAPGSAPRPAFPDLAIQWRGWAGLAGHSCGGSPGSRRYAPLPGSLFIPFPGTCRGCAPTACGDAGQDARAASAGAGRRAWHDPRGAGDPGVLRGRHARRACRTRRTSCRVPRRGRARDASRSDGLGSGGHGSGGHGSGCHDADDDGRCVRRWCRRGSIPERDGCRAVPRGRSDQAGSDDRHGHADGPRDEGGDCCCRRCRDRDDHAPAARAARRDDSRDACSDDGIGRSGDMSNAA